MQWDLGPGALPPDVREDRQVILQRMAVAAWGPPRDVAVRFGLIGLCVLCLSLAFRDPVPSIWFLGYILVDGGYGLAAAHAAKYRHVVDRTFAAIMGLYALSAAYYLALPLYFFSLEAPTLRLAGAAMLVAFGTYCLTQHARIKPVLIVDGTALFLTSVVLGVLFMRASEVGGWVAPVIGLALGIFNVLSIREIYLNHQRLVASQAALVRSQKMQSLGRLTGGIAHDFNNILTVILGNLDLYDALDAPRERDQAIDEAREAARRAATLTAQLLAYARKSPMMPGPLDMREFLVGLRDMLERVLPRDVRLEIVLPPKLPNVQADQVQLEAALLNLAINARDAMPTGGVLSVSAAAEQLDSPRHIDAETTLAPGRYCRITLSDTGHGIDRDVLPYVTEPFFTTKPLGQASGLGLSMAKGFAEQSGGALRVDSAPDAGATIVLWLPLAPGAHAARRSSDTSGAPAPLARGALGVP